MRVLTLGTFDLFHAGHVGLLQKCRNIAGGDGVVVVAVNPDEFVAQFKGARPVIDERDRMEVVQACRFVDQVILNSGGADSKPAIEEACPDVIVVGDDWRDKDYLGQLRVTANWLEVRKIKIQYVSRSRGGSSTEVKRKVRNLG